MNMAKLAGTYRPHGGEQDGPPNVPGAGRAWVQRMTMAEMYMDLLRREIHALAEDDGPTHARRELLKCRLRKEARDARAFLDVRLRTGGDFERSEIRRRLRLEFPLFYHLDTVMRIFPDDSTVPIQEKDRA
jgi:hypothetical protein